MTNNTDLSFEVIYYGTAGYLSRSINANRVVFKGYTLRQTVNFLDQRLPSLIGLDHALIL